jgi:hypothetical protein
MPQTQRAPHCGAFCHGRRISPETLPPSPGDRQTIQVPKLDGLDAADVGLMDHGAMLLEPGKGGSWTGTMVSETGRVLATCDSAWPRENRRQSVCRLQ